MLGKRLRHLREKRKLSQLELAKKLDMPNQNLSNYERGFRQPDYETLNKIADFFDVTADYLLGRSDDPQLTEKEEKEVDKETKELLNLLDNLPEEERKKYIEKFKAYVDISTHARDDD